MLNWRKIVKMRRLHNLTEEQLGKKIAQAMLNIGATTYRNEPYKWASGMLMHVYNDNRMLLGNYRHRLYVTLGFAHKVGRSALPPDYILGTSMSGIAPAASLSQHMDLPLLIRDGSLFFLYEPDLMDVELREEIRSANVDAIVSFGPKLIPYGVQYANEAKTGFAYVRPKSKDHGKEQKVEGNLIPGSSVILLADGNYDPNKLVADFERETGCNVLFEISHNISPRMIGEQDLFGKTVDVIEDLFSTGGSSAGEVLRLQDVGAICHRCFSIFSYDFNILKNQFSGDSEIGDTGRKFKVPCEIDSLLTFDQLLVEARHLGTFDEYEIDQMEKEIRNFDENYKQFLKEAVM